MPIRCDNPREVGADRIVNGIAGYEKYKTSEPQEHGLIIVDFGTATTFDVVSPQGDYLGGAISPGIQISTDALFTEPRSARVELTMPKRAMVNLQSKYAVGYPIRICCDGGRYGSQNETRNRFPVKVIATGGLLDSLQKSLKKLR